jgi:cytoskeletal protein CcmA (bactofilin family)
VASRKPKLVDGFTAIRAAQEAARHGRGDPVRPDAGSAPKPASGGAPKAGSRIGRSVMPTKREVICPECGAASEVTGMVQLFVCNTCRHRMKLQDMEIPEGEWEGEIEVGGTVIVPSGAVLKGGSITANDIILQGTMAGAEVKATRLITIGSNATPDWVRLRALDLELGKGVNLTPGKPIEGRHLILHGKFSGNAMLTGTLTVHADGDFSGQLRSAGLRVDEGGGLRAQLDVNPEYKPPPPKQRKRPPSQMNKPTRLREPPPPARGAGKGGGTPPLRNSGETPPRSKKKDGSDGRKGGGT